MRRFFALCLIVICSFTLTACGPRDHSVLAGTAIGTVAGAGITAAFDGHPLVGAAIGAGLGAVAGLAIDESRHHGHHRYYAPAPHHRPAPRYHAGHGGPRHHGGHRR